MTDLNGWKHVGYHGSFRFYVRDNERRLVDPKRGQTTFRYWVPSGQGYSAIKKFKGANNRKAR